MSRITCPSFFRITLHHIHRDSYGQNIPIRYRQPPKKLLLGIILQGKKGDFWASEVQKYQEVQKSAFPSCGIIYLSFLLFFSCLPKREQNDKMVIMDDEVYLPSSSVPPLENKGRKEQRIDR
jgi:hypothetical protein